MIGPYAVVLVISFSYRLLFYLYGYRYYEKAWAFIHQRFPKVSDRFNPSFYILFLYSWIAVFFIGVIFHLAGNRLGEYLFIGIFLFFTSPVMMFLNVWRYDKTRAAAALEEFPDGAAIIRRRKFRKKIFLYTLGFMIVLIAGWSSYAYYSQVYAPMACDKLSRSNDAALAQRFKTGAQSLGPNNNTVVGNKCYENVFYTYRDRVNAGSVNAFSYIEELPSGQVLSSCRSQNDGGPTLPPGCRQYHQDYYKLFYQVDFDEKQYLAPMGK